MGLRDPGVSVSDLLDDSAIAPDRGLALLGADQPARPKRTTDPDQLEQRLLAILKER